MISFDEAICCLAELAKPMRTEMVTLDQADGRTLARPVVGSHDSPATLVSAMDGYAVRDMDIATLPARLRIIGKSFAGKSYSGGFPPGTCVRVFTGAAVPEGAERVIVQEAVRADGDIACFSTTSAERRHLRRKASDFAAGAVLIAAGCTLNPQRLVGAAAADIAILEVFSQPRVSIICCGDELAAPGQAKNNPDLIPESISYGVAALARRWGATIAAYERLPDDLAVLQAAAKRTADVSDVIIVIGGASVGEKDFAKSMFEHLGIKFVFNKVAIKPGKPVWLGHVGQKIVMGLPGNPTSALVTARLFLAPLLAGISGLTVGAALAWQSLPLATPVDSCQDRETFLKACMEYGRVAPLSNQDSAAQKALAESDMLIRRPLGAPSAQAGTIVTALTF